MERVCEFAFVKFSRTTQSDISRAPVHLFGPSRAGWVYHTYGSDGGPHYCKVRLYIYGALGSLGRLARLVFLDYKSYFLARHNPHILSAISLYVV